MSPLTRLLPVAAAASTFLVLAPDARAGQDGCCGYFEFPSYSPGLLGQYGYDDGVEDSVIGVGPPEAYSLSQVAWMNRFTVVEGMEELTAVSVMFGARAVAIPNQLGAGGPARVFILSDPNGDGNPADAQVLASAATTIKKLDTGLFNRVEVTPVRLPVGSSFFAAALATDLPMSHLPATLDTRQRNLSAPHALDAWFAAGETGSFTMTDLASAQYFGHPSLVGPTYAGTFMLRAETTPAGTPLVLDGFETGDGRFRSAPAVSGSSAGLHATSARTRDTAVHYGEGGTASMRLDIDDDPAAVAPDGTGWRVRFLSGGGTPSENAVIEKPGWVSFRARTTTPGVRAAVMIDDGAALERAIRTPMIADGEWHLYQWNLADATHWDPFAGTGFNGAIDADLVTIDSLYFDTTVNPATDADAVIWIDNIAWSSLPIVVPEPSAAAAALIILSTSLVAARRRTKR